MISIRGYSVGERIYEGTSTLIYRATRKKDNKAVVIKMLKSQYPSPEEVKQFEHEFNLISPLGIEGVITQYEMVDYRNTRAIVMEDFGGLSLDTFIKRRVLSLEIFLDIALKLVRIISSLHSRNIIHKDIKPHNILLNPADFQVKIIDFGVSISLSREVSHVVDPERLEGTLAYISPEQTGRMNRSIDYRTDFYSLGITFYQMLTGVLPYKTDDPMEMIHCHMAKQPDYPSEINSRIPRSLSDIVMKLLAKRAEDRYQSSTGLEFDLEKCRQLALENRLEENFTVGRHDMYGKFTIPEKLYGRDGEISSLLDFYHKSAGGIKQAVYVSGEGGVGKSALISEIHRPVVEDRGFFISGKYDRFQRNIPYTALIRAFEELIGQILMESEKKVSFFKQQIMDAAGPGAQLLVDIIPELEHIIGSLPEIEQLPSRESQNRFNLVFRNFVRVFAAPEHPLVLFLDDLQYADNASLNLIKVLLLDSQLTHFLFIGSYRKSEVPLSHPLMQLKDELEHEKVITEHIKLTPLVEEDIKAILCDTLHSSPDQARELAHVILAKTGGNPFFVLEFLRMLKGEQLIQFDNGWKWETNKIRNSRITENVVEIMAFKIKKLPADSWLLIQLAACIGAQFSISLLAAVYGASEDEVFTLLAKPIDEGMIIKIDDDARFAHDRIREAAYMLIDEEEKKGLHYRIGKAACGFADSHNNDFLFMSVNQLNRAKELLNGEERELLADLNLKAGLKAKESTAYSAAAEFFREGKTLFTDSSWDTAYKKTLTFYTHWAEVEYLARYYEQADRLFTYIIGHTREIMDEITIYSLQIDYFTNQGKPQEALEAAHLGLKKLGIFLPTKPLKLFSRLEYAFTGLLLAGKKKKEYLLALPEMKNKRILAAMDILSKSMLAAYSTNSWLYFYLAMKMVNLSVKYGNCPQSVNAYSMFQIILSGIIGNYEEGYELNIVAVTLAKRYKSKLLMGKALFHSSFGSHFLRPLKKNINNNILARKYCFEGGDLQYALLSTFNQGFTALFCGYPLEDVSTIFKRFQPFIEESRQKGLINWFTIWNRAAAVLQKGINTEHLLEDEEQLVEELNRAEEYSGLGFYYTVKLLISSIFGTPKEAAGWARKGEEYQKYLLSFPTVAQFAFYSALAFSGARQEYQKLKKIGRQFLALGENNPYTYLGKYYLISAELARISGKPQRVFKEKTASGKKIYEKMSGEKLYEMAIKMALENGFTHEQAISSECAARYYLDRGITRVGAMYMAQARYCYDAWGCPQKVKQLDKRFGPLMSYVFFNNPVSNNRQAAGGTTGAPLQNTLKAPSASQSGADFLDLGTLMKASQAISSQIELEKVLETLIRILVENAGAGKGALIFIENGELIIAAEEDIDERVNVLEKKKVDNARTLCGSIVRYVAKTGKTVILEDALHKGDFIHDDYIKKHLIKSVLCTPIRGQGRTAAVLYLENNLAEAVFTPRRVEVLEMLSTQAAISIENSRLIDQLTEKERLKREMEIAKQVQMSLCPPVPDHPELEIAGIMRPADEIGGDYYDIQFDTKGSLWFAIGDVCGHGLTSGLIMMMAQSSFGTALSSPETITPSAVLARINRLLCLNTTERLNHRNFMTMTVLHYRGKGSFDFAGLHLSFLIYRKKSDTFEKKITIGIFLGIKDEIESITPDLDFVLDPGDILFLFSDGIIEAGVDTKHLWETEGLIKSIKNHLDKSPDLMKDLIIKDALAFSKGRQEDDMTLLIIKRKEEEEEEEE